MDFVAEVVKQYNLMFYLESFDFSNNVTDTFENWYELCFEPMKPPEITWQELLPSLLLYRWKLLNVVANQSSYCSFTFALGNLNLCLY